MTETKIKPEQGLSATTARIKVVSATKDMAAATADVAYTGVGFKPVAIMAVAAINGTIQYATGFADAGLTSGNLYNAQASTNANVDGSFLAVWAAGGGAQTGTLKSLDSDGFTMTWTKYLSPTGTLTIRFICFR